MTEATLRRHMIGACALGCAGIALWRLLVSHDVFQDLALGAFWRVALVMASVWLALPTAGRPLAWGRLLALVLITVVIVSIFRKAAILVLPLIAVAAILAVWLRPKPKRHTRRQ